MFSFLKKKKKKVRPSEPKISVIMPVYLGEYKGCATDREQKFKDAIGSFIVQKYKKRELIIVSDGCDIAEDIYYNNFCYDNIKFFKIPKQDTFSGNVRDFGLQKAEGDLICYLDSDDLLGSNHLTVLANGIKPEIDFVYYNDVILIKDEINFPSSIPRTVNLEHGSIGTSTIAHWKDLNRSWKGLDGYGHDWLFIKSMIHDKLKSKKINGAEYYVTHIPNIIN